MLEFIDIIKWPLALVVCVVIANVSILRHDTAWPRSTRRLGKSAIDFAPAPAEQQKAMEPPSQAAPLTVPIESALPPPMEIYTPIEKEITTALDSSKYPPDIQKAWLIRTLAAARVWRGHEDSLSVDRWLSA